MDVRPCVRKEKEAGSKGASGSNFQPWTRHRSKEDYQLLKRLGQGRTHGVGKLLLLAQPSKTEETTEWKKEMRAQMMTGDLTKTDS